MPGTFSPPPWVSDPDMLHGTCVTHVLWCMPGTLTSGFLWSRWRGKRSRHSRRMRNPQFYVSGKKLMRLAFYDDITTWKRPCTESKVHGANKGLTWGRQDPGGPHVGHMNLAIWGFLPFWSCVMGIHWSPVDSHQEWNVEHYIFVFSLKKLLIKQWSCHDLRHYEPHVMSL